jgi:hypothetical protein
MFVFPVFNQQPVTLMLQKPRRPHPAFPEGKKQGGILWPQDATSGEILRGNGYYQETIMNIVQNSFPPCFLCNVEGNKQPSYAPALELQLP